MKEIYLGDGVYAKYNGQELTVYTSNGMHPTNSVYMERAEIANLVEFLRECGLVSA